MSNCQIMQRMKDNYEGRSQTYLTRRTPAIIRIDGKAFSSLTKGMKKPFDPIFISVMQKVAMELCKEVQGCKLGFVFSDEISLLLTDYDTLTTEAWFNYNIQKMTSVSASIATFYFNHFMWEHNYPWERVALFDSRAFSIPKEEVCNYFIARQKDCIRNSVSGLAQALFTNRELQKLNSSQLQYKMKDERHINWDELDTWKKRGTCIIKKGGFEINNSPEATFTNIVRPKWESDIQPPIFSEKRDYIESLI